MSQNYNNNTKPTKSNDVIAQNSNLQIVKSNKPEGTPTFYTNGERLNQQTDHVIYTHETNQLISIFRKQYNNLLLNNGEISSLRDKEAFKGREAGVLQDLIRLLGVRLNERKKNLQIVSYGDLSLKLSIGYLAEVFKMSKSTVKRHLNKLESLHLISVEREGQFKRIYINNFMLYLNRYYAQIHQHPAQNRFAEKLEKIDKKCSFWTVYNIIQEINNSLVKHVDKDNTTQQSVLVQRVLQGATETKQFGLDNQKTNENISPAAGENFEKQTIQEIKRVKFLQHWSNFYLQWMIANLYQPNGLELTEYQKNVVLDYFIDYADNLELWELQKHHFGKKGKVTKAFEKWKRWVNKKQDRFTPLPSIFFNENTNTAFHSALNWVEVQTKTSTKNKFKHKNNIEKLARRANRILTGEINGDFSSKTYQFRLINRELTDKQRLFVYNKIVLAAEKYCRKHKVEHLLQTFERIALNNIKAA